MTREWARPIRTLVGFQKIDESFARDALRAGADAVWFDLEDYIPTGKLVESRKLLAGIVQRLSTEGHTVLVRVHTGAERDEVALDVDEILEQGVYGFLLPKTEVGDVTALSRLLDDAERRFDIPVGRTQLFPLIETASAVENAYVIAQESTRIAHMGWCVSRDGDPARSIGFRWTPEGIETLYMRSKVLMGARAGGVPYPVGGGHIVLADAALDPAHVAGIKDSRLEDLRQFAIRERNLGLLGIACDRDPDSIAVVNAAFTPTADEVAAWKDLVAAEEEAASRGEVRRPSAARHAQAQLAHAARLAELYG